MRADVKETLDAWATTGRPTGGFVRAVLEDSLSRAVARADADNERDLVEITRYVYNYIPASCWGSEEKVREWAKMMARQRSEGRAG